MSLGRVGLRWMIKEGMRAWPKLFQNDTKGRKMSHSHYCKTPTGSPETVKQTPEIKRKYFIKERLLGHNDNYLWKQPLCWDPASHSCMGHFDTNQRQLIAFFDLLRAVERLVESLDTSEEEEEEEAR